MRKVAMLAVFAGAALAVSCVTNSKLITDPPGMNVAVNGMDFGPSPCDIQSTGTTFGEYTLELRDSGDKVVFSENLPKNVRIWGIFWPPYGIFYNLYEFHPRYTVRKVTLSDGSPTWAVTTY
ncbi:MAG TPA: hypothetical protein VMT52_13570 [Planctomycetota bacterium]|nr:hypothetical protein [Planctomycetota bacterium]